MAKDLPPPNEFALHRIGAAETEARRQLEVELRQFFERCASGAVHRELQRNPSSEDLLPFFERYSRAVFDARAKEQLALVLSGDQLPTYFKWLEKLADPVVRKIYGRKFGQHAVKDSKTAAYERLRRTLYRKIGDGVWRGAVEKSLGIFGFSAYRTEYGEYGLGDFLRPNTVKLKAMLDDRLLYWKAQAQVKIGTTISDQVGAAASPVAPAVAASGGSNLPLSPPLQSEARGEVEIGGTSLSPGERSAEPQPEAATANATTARDTDLLRKRARQLAEYKAATGNPSNKKIYEARNSGIHKPEFYKWLRGDLPANSATCINFERFLREKKPPIPRKPRH